MHFLELPNEILLHILEAVGTSFFRSDLSRLTICKHWNSIARIVCFRDFHVTSKTLRSLLSSPYAQSSMALIQNNLEVLHLELCGPENRKPDSEARDNGGASKWQPELNTNLLQLAEIMKMSHKLRMVRIQDTVELRPSDRPMRCNYLSRFALRAILSVSPSNLTSLELDLGGTDLLPRPSKLSRDKGHFCTAIAPLLTKLRRLRLRMRRICSDALRPQQHSTGLRLNEVLINIGLPYDSPWITSAPQAAGCRFSVSRADNHRLEDELREQAKVLITEMAEPKMIRILTHAHTECGLHAFDVLTDTYLKLDEDAEWDAAGEVLAESDDEAEVSEPNSDEEKMHDVFHVASGEKG